MLALLANFAEPIVLAARRSTEDNTALGFKVLAVLVILVIWGIAALVKAMQKSGQSRQREVVAPPPVPRTSPARTPVVRKPLAVQRRVVPAAPPVVSWAQVAPAPPAVYARASSPAPPIECAVSRPIAAAKPAVSAPAMNAQSIRTWLTPEILQKQYVLTELFDPPPSGR
jgi:hypothetical protein